MRGRWSGAIPEPVSATETITPPRADSSETVIRPPVGVCRRAFSSRLVRTWRNASGSAVTWWTSPAPARQGAAGDQQRATDALQLLRLRFVPTEHGRHQVAGRLLVEQLGERGKRIIGSVAQEAPRRAVEGDDRAAGVGRHDAVGHGLDQRRGLLALADQVGEALVELRVHGAERDDVLGDLGDA